MSEPVKMNVREWARQEHEIIDAFVEYWEANRVEEPENWPEELHPGDLDEQFWIFHNDCEEKLPEDT